MDEATAVYRVVKASNVAIAARTGGALAGTDKAAILATVEAPDGPLAASTSRPISDPVESDVRGQEAHKREHW
jgi:hypothetical protein